MHCTQECRDGQISRNGFPDRPWDEMCARWSDLWRKICGWNNVLVPWKCKCWLSQTFLLLFFPYTLDIWSRYLETKNTLMMLIILNGLIWAPPDNAQVRAPKKQRIFHLIHNPNLQDHDKGQPFPRVWVPTFAGEARSTPVDLKSLPWDWDKRFVTNTEERIVAGNLVNHSFIARVENHCEYRNVYAYVQVPTVPG